MIKKGIFLILLILVFFTSLVSAIHGLPPNFDPQINSQKVINDNIIRRLEGNGGNSDNSATSAPTGPTPNADELIAQMNEELKLTKIYADAVDRDLLKIKNRNSVENLQVSIFGGDPNLASSIQQNIGQSYDHFSRINELNSQCNCIGRSGPIIKEADSIIATFISKSNQAEAERENKGMVGEIMNVISGAKKQPVYSYHPEVTICAGPGNDFCE